MNTPEERRKLMQQLEEELKEEIEEKTKEKVKDKREEVKEELIKISQTKGLTPSNVVETARNEQNILHDCFEWENAIAGEKYREWQARFLINSIDVIITTPQGEEKKVGLFESITIKGEGRTYKPVYEIINDTTLKQQIIEKALQELVYWKNKHKIYSEFKTIIKEIETTERRLDKEKWQKKATKQEKNNKK